MQVILFEHVDKLGMQGDVVNVANGHFRNYLGPHSIAVEATAVNLKRHESKRKKLQLEAERQRGVAEELATQISTIEMEFERRASENDRLYGSVQDHEILEVINSKGFTLERRQIIMREPLKEVGVFAIKIRLIGDVMAEVKVTVIAEGAAERAAEEARQAEERAAAKAARLAEAEAAGETTEDAEATTEEATEEAPVEVAAEEADQPEA